MEIDPSLLVPPFTNPDPNPHANPQQITARLIAMESKCDQANRELETAMEEYRTFVREIGFDIATTLSPDHWGVLSSIKQELRAGPEHDQASEHPLDRHYFPEISLGPDLVVADFPALSDSWTRKAYDLFKEQAAVGGIHGQPRRGSKAIKEENKNVMMTFIQDKGGVPVDGETAQAIRARATEILYTIATHREDDIAPTWGQVDSNCKDFYRAKLCQFWPDLRMCAFNWKADAIAAIVYPTWYRRFSGENWRKRYLSDQGEGPDSQRKKRRRRGPHLGPSQNSLPSSLPSSSQSSSSSQSPPPSQLQSPPPSQSPLSPDTSLPSQSSPGEPSPGDSSSSSDNPDPSQQAIPFIDDPFSDRPASEIPATLTARLLTLTGPTSTTSTTPAPGAASAKKKHPNKTLSPKNLFLIDYYKTHDLVSNDEFKQLWDGLSQDQQKVWERMSKDAHNAKKATEDGPA